MSRVIAVVNQKGGDFMMIIIRIFAIALGTFLIPMTAGVVLAGIEIADLWLRNILLSQYGGSLH